MNIMFCTETTTYRKKGRGFNQRQVPLPFPRVHTIMTWCAFPRYKKGLNLKRSRKTQVSCSPRHTRKNLAKIEALYIPSSCLLITTPLAIEHTSTRYKTHTLKCTHEHLLRFADTQTTHTKIDMSVITL